MSIKQIMACALTVLLSSSPAFAQIATESIPPPPRAYTIATLPTSGISDGQMARITDGDAAGSLIFWDDSTSTWRCYVSATLGWENIACPPYNAKAANSNNHDEVQAAISYIAADETDPYRCLIIPNGDYHVTSGLDWTDDDSEMDVCMQGLGNRSTLTFDYTGTDPGLDIGAGMVTNSFEFYNFALVGGSSGGNAPDYLLRCSPFCAQVEMHGVNVGHWKEAGIFLFNPIHANISNALCAGGTSSTAGSECILVNGGGYVRIHHMYVENDGTNGGFVRLWSTGVLNHFQIMDITIAGSEFGVIGSAFDNIHGVEVSNLHGNVLNIGISLSGFTGDTDNDCKIIDNSLRNSRNPAVSGDVGIYANCTYGTEIVNNTLRNFYTGIRTAGIRGHVNGNEVFDAVDDCYNIQGAGTSFWDNNLASDCGNKGVSWGPNAQSGGGIFKGFQFAGTVTTKFSGALTYLTATDRFYLAKGVQTVICNGSSTAEPYYATVVLSNTSGDCDWTPGTAYTFPGQTVTVVASTVTGTATIHGATDEAITPTDVFLYVYWASAWRKINYIETP